MWIDPKELSRWAYFQCIKSKRNDIINLITDSKWAYLYCKTIKDDKKIRDNIKTAYWAFKYLKNVAYSKQMVEKIKGTEWEYWLEQRR